jgi:hypothetical protein
MSLPLNEANEQTSCARKDFYVGVTGIFWKGGVADIRQTVDRQQRLVPGESRDQSRRAHEALQLAAQPLPG